MRRVKGEVCDTDINPGNAFTPPSPSIHCQPTQPTRCLRTQHGTWVRAPGFLASWWQRKDSRKWERSLQEMVLFIYTILSRTITRLCGLKGAVCVPAICTIHPRDCVDSNLPNEWRRRHGKGIELIYSR